MRNKVKSLSIVLGSLLFVSCGGGGGVASAPVVTTPFSTITGTISDGPIENAKVCILDVELGSEYCPTYTDKDGKYSFEYILENGKQYLITAKGDGLTTVDEKDNPGDKLTFVMFNPLTTTGSIASTQNIGTTYNVNINPVTFKEAIKANFSDPTIIATGSSIENFVKDTSTDSTTLFKNYVKDNSNNTDVTTFIDKVKIEIKSNNDTSSQQSVTPTYKEVTDTTLRTQLVKGDTYNMLGFEDLINTYIAYKVINDARNNSNSSAYTIFKTTPSGANTIVNFKYDAVDEKYEGTVMYDTTGNLIDANYYQEYSYNDNRGANTLSGYIKIENDTGTHKLSLRKGQFKVLTDNYVESFISGNVTILDARTQYSITKDSLRNTIDLADATITVPSLPTLKAVSADFNGIWNGTYGVTTGTCVAGNMSISLKSSAGSWQADNTNYGTEAILNTISNKVILKNGTTVWSSNGTLTIDKTTISGTWIDGTCTGTYTITKQISNQ